MTTAVTSPRRTNRRAFGKVDPTSPLLQLYCKLVAVELALKDVHGRGACSPGGHNFIGAIQNPSHAYPTVVQVALTPLITALQGLRKEGAALVPSKYPEMRYLDHATDQAGGTTDVQLRDALRLTNDLIKELNTHWHGLPTPLEAVVP